jgi:hypothetical protein
MRRRRGEDPGQAQPEEGEKHQAQRQLHLDRQPAFLPGGDDIRKTYAGHAFRSNPNNYA